MPDEVVSFFLMLASPQEKVSPCVFPAVNCPLAFWMLRASNLGALLESESGRDVAVDAFTPCMPGGEREAKSGVTIRVHSQFPPELQRLVSRLPSAKLSITLLKWVAVSLTDAEFACAFDLDMDIFMPWLGTPEHRAAVAADWLGGLRRMRIAGVQFGALPDHSSPINAGFMLLRPNATL